MSELNELEAHIFAYYISSGLGRDFTAAPRRFPYGELVLVLEDKIKVATRKFGFKVTMRAKAVANALLDRLIAEGGYDTKENDFGGTMHQFQPDAYRALLAQWSAADPVSRQAEAGGPEYWETAFARLTA